MCKRERKPQWPKAILKTNSPRFGSRWSATPQPEREFYFHPERRWRFDFAFPSSSVAVEMEGGTWTGGRHSRGSGVAGDCEKYNAATMLGWSVLRYTTTDIRVKPVQVIEEVQSLVKAKDGLFLTE